MLYNILTQSPEIEQLNNTLMAIAAVTSALAAVLVLVVLFIVLAKLVALARSLWRSL